jgi:hypothetical protein
VNGVQPALVRWRRAGLVADSDGTGTEGLDAGVGAKAGGVRADVTGGFRRWDAGAVDVVKLEAVEGAGGKGGEGNDCCLS